jgi:hypothetical protein
MGTWGTGISSNDDYADVYSEFFELYNEGKDVAEITALVIARNGEMLSMPEAVNNVWFAIAKAQWDCKQLQPDVYERVKNIIDSESDLQVWTELGATKSEVEKRQKVLKKFLSQLQSDRPKAKARKKKVIRDPIFRKGDCLTFKLKNGNFGGAVVLEAEYGTELALNLVTATRINEPERPTTESFRNAEVLIKNFANWKESAQVIWICNYKPKEVHSLIEVIGSITVTTDYLSKEQRHRYAYTSGWKSALIDATNRQFESEKTKGRPKTTLKVKKVLHGSFLDRLFS